ncbi:hypothetical protein EAI_04330, partial [Harpegnathos saltator]
HSLYSFGNYLDATFPHRWIGRDSRVWWLSSSPDLTPLGFYLWGFFKDAVFRQPLTT